MNIAPTARPTLHWTRNVQLADGSYAADYAEEHPGEGNPDRVWSIDMAEQLAYDDETRRSLWATHESGLR